MLTLFAFASLAQTPADTLQPEIRHRLTLGLSGDVEQKRSALAEIRNIHTPEASELAVPRLTDPSQIVRATAASAVVFLPSVEATDAIAPLLQDKSDFVRREAAYSLGTVGGPQITPPLLRLLEKEKLVEVRSAAAIALGRSGDTSVVAPLLNILKKRPSEAEEFLRRSAARSIGQIAQFVHTGTFDTLTPRNFLPAKFNTPETPSLPAAGIPGPAFGAAISVLSKMLENKNEADDTRREAAFALGAVGDPSSIAALRAKVRSTDPYLAEICREALLKLGQTE